MLDFLYSLLGRPLVSVEVIRDVGLADQTAGYVVTLQEGAFTVMADDEAEIRLQIGVPKLSAEHTRHPASDFDDLIGCCFGDYWYAKNSQGYQDFLQLMFYETESKKRHCIQMIGMPLILDSYRLDH